MVGQSNHLGGEQMSKRANNPLASQPGADTPAPTSDDPTIAEIAHALDDWYSGLGRQYGPLSRPQRRMLRLIAAGPPVRVGDLAEGLGLTTAGATRMLDTLESLGYASRVRGAEKTDQRQVYVALTAAGADALRAADAVYLARVASRARRLTDDERAQLARLLRTMAPSGGATQ